MEMQDNTFKFFELLKGIIKTSKFILDIGSSEGSIPKDYFSVKNKLVSLDIDKKLLVKNPNKKKIIANAYLLPFRDEHFDFVILKYVLEHLDQPELVVSQLRAILKRNQFVYVVVPKYYAFQDTIYRILGKTAELLRLGKQAHIAKFTFGTLCKLFYDNGFIMIDFYEADAGLSFLDKTSARRNLKKIILLFIYLIKKITGKNLLERNEMHFLFCKFE